MHQNLRIFRFTVYRIKDSEEILLQVEIKGPDFQSALRKFMGRYCYNKKIYTVRYKKIGTIEESIYENRSY